VHCVKHKRYSSKQRQIVICLGLACLLPASAQTLHAQSLFGWGRFAGQSADSGPASNVPIPAVARIIVPEKDGASFGSGTLVARHGSYALVVTNWHVVEDATGDVVVTFPSGHHSPGRIYNTDSDWDLAAILINAPEITPIEFATRAPQPGDRLTIAGYGSGQFRSVSGRCTQYVAPGKDFPYEMVELSAQARQGDSGGPILNQQGQLAGVLFGAAGGTTSGSFVGRVQRFLAPAIAQLQSWDGSRVATHSTPQMATLHPEAAATANVSEPLPERQLAQIPPAPAANHGTTAKPAKSVQIAKRITPTPPLPVAPNYGPDITSAPLSQSPPSRSPLKPSGLPLDHLKTAFALIGVFAVSYQILRLLPI